MSNLLYTPPKMKAVGSSQVDFPASIGGAIVCSDPRWYSFVWAGNMGACTKGQLETFRDALTEMLNEKR